jgi:hypothetical protein
MLIREGTYRPGYGKIQSATRTKTTKHALCSGREDVPTPPLPSKLSRHYTLSKSETLKSRVHKRTHQVKRDKAVKETHALRSGREDEPTPPVSSAGTTLLPQPEISSPELP